jgi:hypothetical protein
MYIDFYVRIYMIRIFIREYKYTNLLWANETLKGLVEDPSFGRRIS